MLTTAGAHGAERHALIAPAGRLAPCVRFEGKAPCAILCAVPNPRRPVEAALAAFVQVGTDTVACRRKEDAVAVRSCELISGHTVLHCPLISGVIQQFRPVAVVRQPGATAKQRRGRVVVGFEIRLPVNELVEFAHGVLGQTRQSAVVIGRGKTIGGPVVNRLGAGLAPGEIVAIAFGTVSPDIASGPLQAARQPKVNELGLAARRTGQGKQPRRAYKRLP